MASQLASLTNQQALYSNHKTYVGEPQSSCQIVCVLWLGVGPLETLSSHANVLIDFAIVELLFMHPFLGLTVSHRLPGIKALRTFQLSFPYHCLSHNSGSYDTDVSTGTGLLMIYVQWGFFVTLFLCDDH